MRWGSIPLLCGFDSQTGVVQQDRHQFWGQRRGAAALCTARLPGSTPGVSTIGVAAGAAAGLAVWLIRIVTGRLHHFVLLNAQGVRLRC